ncbi:MAG: hypothetical protein ACI9XZ_004263 [Alphaproteobacteria bacterium]|jgi:hypothetical protein
MGNSVHCRSVTIESWFGSFYTRHLLPVVTRCSRQLDIQKLPSVKVVATSSRNFLHLFLHRGDCVPTTFQEPLDLAVAFTVTKMRRNIFSLTVYRRGVNSAIGAQN